jgi:hypothetical protein
MESFATSISFQDIKTLSRAVTKKEKDVLKIDPAYSKIVKAANYLDKNFLQCITIPKDSKKTLSDFDFLYYNFAIIQRNYEFEYRFFPALRKKYSSLTPVTNDNYDVKLGGVECKLPADELLPRGEAT